jgi:NitT/TauT family transport system substrate-binding protein
MALTEGATAADKLVVSVTGAASWDTSVVAYCQRLGFFEEQNLDVKIAATDVMSQNIQAVIAGSADVGSAAVPVLIAAGIQGAPVKMIASYFKGASDFLWYVRSDSPIKSFKDVTPDTTIGTASLGSNSHILAAAFLDQYGKTAKIVPVGPQAAALAQIMAGQVDVTSNGNGLLGVPEYASGEVRPIAYGKDLTIMDGVTARGFVVSTDTLAKRREVLVRFLQALQKTIDWMYSDPKAIEWFAEATQASIEDAKRVREFSYPAGSLAIEDVTGIDVTVKQLIDYKRIDRAPTAEELSNMFDIVWKRPPG